MNVVVYSTNCPKCHVLETKLKGYDIDYELVTDTDVMIQKGFTEAPMFEVDGEVMDFISALNWLKERSA